MQPIQKMSELAKNALMNFFYNDVMSGSGREISVFVLNLVSSWDIGLCFRFIRLKETDESGYPNFLNK